MRDCRLVRSTRKRTSTRMEPEGPRAGRCSTCCADTDPTNYTDDGMHPLNQHLNLRRLEEEVADCERGQSSINANTMRSSDNNDKQTTRSVTLIRSGMFRVITLSFFLTLNVFVRFTNGAMSLPDGIENILGFVPRSTFKCERDGYFGDIDNDCRIFHLCQKQVNPNGRTEWRHWTYACGNQTMFNQLTLTCAFVDEAIPCKHASQFQYLNEVIHKPKEPFLTDADVTSGVSYYSNRIMSDGARNRAFEDSRLMAQLGGQEMFNSVQASFHHSRNQFHQQHQNRRRERQSFAVDTANLIEPAPISSDPLQFGNLNSDSEENPQRAANSIELGASLNEAFERASSFAFQPPANHLGSVNGGGDTTSSELIINHRHHFEHDSGRPEPSRPINERAEDGNQQLGAQAARNLFASAAASQLPAQPRSTGGPHSFDFSISTEHQIGPPLNEPREVQFVPSQQHQAAVASVTVRAEPSTTSAKQPEESQTIGPSTFANRLPPAIVSTLAPGNEPRAIATLRPQIDGPTTTEARLIGPTTTTTTTQRTLEPATTLGSATTTSRATTTTTTISAERTDRPSQPRRRQSSQQLQVRNNQTSRVAVRQRQQDHQNQQLMFHHMHSNFQSERISAQPKRPQAESSLVMRRQVQTSNQPVTGSQAVAPAAASQPIAPTALTNEPSSGNFWRHSFGAQLLAPRFESLLTRRRV